MAEPNSCEAVVLELGQKLMEIYWSPMFQLVETSPELVRVVPGFLIRPDQIVFHFGKTHIGIEYVGPERLSELPREEHLVETYCHDYTLRDTDFFSEIIGFDYGNGPKLPLAPVSYDFVLPTNAGVEELNRLNWNWSAQEMIVGFNTGGLTVPTGQFTRIVNGRFFDADSDGLKTRYIRWLDLIPCEYDDSGDELDTFRFSLGIFRELAEVDPRKPYPLPWEYRLERLQALNRFVEFVGDRKHSEPEITGMLSEPDYRFIMKSRFAAADVRPQLLCEWQGDTRDAIQPDFFVVNTDGYADIVEFKLPYLKNEAVVGRSNREVFSAEINSYIGQTRVYREYFNDPRNRDHVKERYGFKVYKPRRILVVGRRSHLDSSEWKAIEADYSGLRILSYDDLIDGVVAQFYDSPAGA